MITTYKGLEPATKATMVRIINNVAKVIKTGNIELLSKQAYNYLYLCSGFIAHYSHGGFMDYYQDTAKLKQDLLDNENANQWRNFHPSDNDYEYYHHKALIYAGIINAIDPDEWPKQSAPKKQKKPIQDFDMTPNTVGEAIDFFRHTSNSLLA